MRRLTPICLLLVTSALGAAQEVPPPATPVIRMAPVPPSTRDRMRSWHRQYRGRIVPVRREWEALERAARGRPGDRLTAGCRRLGQALGELEPGRLPVAPDPSVSLHLEETLRSLAAAADSCTQGAFFLTTWRLRQADDSWRELRGRLLLYGLTP